MASLQDLNDSLFKKKHNIVKLLKFNTYKEMKNLSNYILVGDYAS